MVGQKERRVPKFTIMPTNGGEPYEIEADEARPETNFYCDGVIVETTVGAYRLEPDE